MKKNLILACICVPLLAACATTGGSSSNFLAAGLAIEAGAQHHCPENTLQQSLFTAARVTFDLNYWPRLNIDEANALLAMRVVTDKLCPVPLPQPIENKPIDIHVERG